MTNISAKGLAKSSYRRIKSVLSSAFSFAIRMGLVTVNPITHIRIPKRCKPVAETEAYSPAETAAMIAFLPEPTASIVAVAAYAGLRKGEIRGLQRPGLQREPVNGFAVGLEPFYDGAEIGREQDRRSRHRPSTSETRRGSKSGQGNVPPFPHFSRHTGGPGECCQPDSQTDARGAWNAVEGVARLPRHSRHKRRKDSLQRKRTAEC